MRGRVAGCLGTLSFKFDAVSLLLYPIAVDPGLSSAVDFFSTAFHLRIPGSRAMFNPNAQLRVEAFEDRWTCIVVDDALRDPDELVRYAAAQHLAFRPAANFYPGVWQVSSIAARWNRLSILRRHIAALGRYRCPRKADQRSADRSPDAQWLLYVQEESASLSASERRRGA
jgi:hypothetical protein